jgi:hypothetical protein
MSASAGLKNFRVDTFAVISHTYAEFASTISDFHLDVPRVRVTEGVAERLGGNVVKLACEERSQRPGCALDIGVKVRRRGLRLTGRELLGKPADRRFQIRALVFRGA